VSNDSSNWLEVANTLRDLAEINKIKIEKEIRFKDPYAGPEGMPAIVEETYQSTRSQSIILIVYINTFLYCVHEIVMKCHYCNNDMPNDHVITCISYIVVRTLILFTSTSAMHA